MRRNPMYSFRDRTTVGIFEVPLNSTIHIIDDGSGKPMFVEIIAKTGLGTASTIGEFLDKPELYVDLNAEVIPSELERVQEGPNTGWRMYGRDPQFYNEIGLNAIDLSRSTQATSGASARDTFTVGVDVSADHLQSVAIGSNLTTNFDKQLVVGEFNSTTNTYLQRPQFVVGIGNSAYDLQDGLVVYKNGIVRAPGAEVAVIAQAPGDTLVTRDYSDDVDGGNLA